DFISIAGEDGAEMAIGEFFFEPVSQAGKDRFVIRSRVGNFDEKFAAQDREHLDIFQIGGAIGDGRPAHASDSISSGTPWARRTSWTPTLPPQILGGSC